ncbi:putative signal transducing protein [Pontibacter sp. MBLB2868]|uniref:putative signal transducing protein n=1 Tax=Pontibacter sp. MBLB2868 TaxID=3451555 RepID=UPI003F74B84B
MPERLITIAAFNDATEAHIMKGRLEAEGILCFLGDENIVSAQPFYSVAVGGVKLKVTENDVMEAKAILSRIEEGSSLFDYDSIELAPPMQEHQEAIRCPDCASENVAEEKFNKTVFSVSYLLLGFPLPFLSRKHTCYDCGHSWKGK